MSLRNRAHFYVSTPVVQVASERRADQLLKSPKPEIDHPGRDYTDPQLGSKVGARNLASAFFSFEYQCAYVLRNISTLSFAPMYSSARPTISCCVIVYLVGTYYSNFNMASAYCTSTAVCCMYCGCAWYLVMSCVVPSLFLKIRPFLYS